MCRFFAAIGTLRSLVMIRRISVVAATLAAVMAVSGCANTVRGVGRDVGNTVDATAAAANDVAR
jgi:predicted small secreted protein